MILDSARVKRGFDWVKVRRNAEIAAAVLFAFAAGGWFTSIRNQEARLPYLERATHKQEQAQAVAGGDPVKVINCERRARRVAENVAGQAVTFSTYGKVPEAILDNIPDCPAPKK